MSLPTRANKVLHAPASHNAAFVAAASTKDVPDWPAALPPPSETLMALKPFVAPAESVVKPSLVEQTNSGAAPAPAPAPVSKPVVAEVSVPVAAPPPPQPTPNVVFERTPPTRIQHVVADKTDEADEEQTLPFQETYPPPLQHQLTSSILSSLPSQFKKPDDALDAVRVATKSKDVGRAVVGLLGVMALTKPSDAVTLVAKSNAAQIVVAAMRTFDGPPALTTTEEVAHAGCGAPHPPSR